MFGSLGIPELLIIFIVALIVFGPKRLPEIGRTLGKALGEFKKATDDFKNTIEREVQRRGAEADGLDADHCPCIDIGIKEPSQSADQRPAAARPTADRDTEDGRSHARAVTRTTPQQNDGHRRHEPTAAKTPRIPSTS